MGVSTELKAEDLRRVENAVVRYLTEGKGWKRGSFRLDHKGLCDEGKTARVWAIALEDEANPAPGAGKSIELRVDRRSYRVIRELGFQ